MEELLVDFFLILFICWKIYEMKYYKSKEFLDLKNSWEKYVKDCNELNEHIKNLKNTYLGINALDYGKSDYYDKSLHKYKRPELKKQMYQPNVHNCSRIVCDNARKQPFKYICKYFDIKANEKTLENFEKVINNFEAAQDGKIALKNEKDRILKIASKEVPVLIRILSKKKLSKKIGFEEMDFNDIEFPVYIFNYISSGGYASLKCEITMDMENLNKFVKYLSQIIEFKKSIEGQRSLLTSSLRKEILLRDKYTCQYCGNSIEKEPNLLLEIDHIIPLSKGGITAEDNLQTLCWKCNRAKGNKIIPSGNKNHRTALEIVKDLEKERIKQKTI